jgi:glycine/D-amino acid oxidase-like deaminating enzyme
MLDRAELQHMLPAADLGPSVSGAVFCSRDAHVNPLLLLCALKVAIVRRGGAILAAAGVCKIERDGDGFAVASEAERYSADRLVIAAGVATPPLARQVGLDVPVRPQRGQILVTERLAPILPMPTVPIRQTAEGTVLIGSSQEEVGFDIGTTAAVAKRMATRAVEILPALRNATVVRQWSGLRVMSPDVAPIYAESGTSLGAWAATCHSGVTLAAAHATCLAPAIDSGILPPELAHFHSRRFDVPQAA